MLIDFKRGQGSIVLRVKILNSSVTTGAGLTGLTSASSGLIISTIADNESTATAYAVGSSNVESITTLGTFAAPTSGKCRFKEVDSTNHKGVYEIQIADARFAVSNAKSLLISISGATNAAETDVCIPLRDLDPYDSVRAGLTALPNAAAAASGGLIINGSNSGTVTLAALTVTGSFTISDGLLISRSSSNTSAITATGNGTGSGAVFTSGSGATGNGIKATAASANGSGMSFVSTGTGSGILTDKVTASGAVAWQSTFTVTGTMTVGSLYNNGTKDEAQTGDSFARIGGTGSGLTSLAQASTALSTAQWTNTLATNLGTTNSTVASNLDATVSSRSTYAGGDTAGTTTLLSRVTASRSGYWDNLNVGGVVASQADITALNQSASRRIILTTVQQYERPTSGNSTYTIEARTYDGDGADVNADTTPTLTATGIVSGSLAANLSPATNPATGVYRWTYTVASDAVVEQIAFDISVMLSASNFTLTAYTQVVDLVAATWTTTDASNLTAIYNKLPTNDIADQTILASAAANLQTDVDDIQTRLPAALVSGRMDVTIGAMQTGVLTAASIAAGALDGKGDWLLSSSYTAPPSAATISSTVWSETTRVLTAGTNIVLAKDVGVTGFNDIAAGAAMTLTSGAYTAVSEAVVDQTLTGHASSGTVGEALVEASEHAMTDPWESLIPGAYAEGSAGYIVGNLLDAAISSRLASSAYTAPDNPTDYVRNDVAPDWFEAGILTAEQIWTYPDRTLAAAALDAILVATGLEEGRFVDSNGDPVNQINLRQAVALLLSYSAGDRSGVGTREIIAKLAGETTQVVATRSSQSAIESTGIVPV